MIIWLVALLLLGLLALIGYYQGVIRVAISLVGLFVAALLAVPLSFIIKPILPAIGFKHPIWEPIIPPLVIFVLVMIIFKVIALFVHRKVNVFYKYKTDDKRAIKWERLSQRLGLALGLVNGAVYFVLLLIPFYVAGYLTTQIASGAEDPAKLRFLNDVRTQIQETKVDNVVAAYDPAPENFYVAADIIGLMKNNPLLHNRLSRYPVFLSLAERPEFQAIANDVQINEMIQTQAKIGDIINHPKVQAILTNAAISKEVGTLLSSDLQDLHEYLKTGKSEKYDDEKILGLWRLNLDATVAQEKIANPKITPLQLRQLKQTKYAPMRGVTLTCTTDNKAILKNAPISNDTSATILASGTWSSFGSGYKLSIEGATADATFENGRLLIPRTEMTMVFDKEL